MPDIDYDLTLFIMIMYHDEICINDGNDGDDYEDEFSSTTDCDECCQPARNLPFPRYLIIS